MHGRKSYVRYVAIGAAIVLIASCMSQSPLASPSTVRAADQGETVPKVHLKNLAISQKLADADPVVLQYQFELAAAQSNLGHLLARQK
jgi:hypothetical protein